MTDLEALRREAERLKRLREAATPGPWMPSRGDIYEEDQERWSIIREKKPCYFIASIENGAPGDTLETEKATAEFIAAAGSSTLPELVLALLDELEKKGKP